MSAQQPPLGGANGPQSGPQQGNQAQPAQNNMSPQNLNQIVLEYLVKKGYKQTEKTLRQESAQVDSGSSLPSATEDSPEIYIKALSQLIEWYDRNLEIYKAEIRRVLWPVFVYSYLEVVSHYKPEDAQTIMKRFAPRFEQIHDDELKILQSVVLRPHVFDNETARLYMNNKYSVPLVNYAYYSLIAFLESISKSGGDKIIFLLATYCEVKIIDRGPLDQYSFENIVAQARGDDGTATNFEEGIPGAFTGVTNKDMKDNTAILKLGMWPMDPDLAGDVRAELAEEDSKHPPIADKATFVDEFDQIVKREDSAEAPSRDLVPLPPSRARDVVMEMQKVKEHRDRLKIDGRTGGIGPAVSVCMFTFHNTLDSITCIEFSDDNNLVAVGTEDSYIRVWHLHGEVLKSITPSKPGDPAPTSSRRLIGHSAPTHSVSFSPSIAAPANESESTPSTSPRLLLSASVDGTIRLWSLEAWVCLIVYKGHDGPVWNVRWHPFGHYFASCGRDKTVRVWSQDHISYLRMMVGHDTSVSQVAWHPNGTYVFSASDEADKTVRMWSVATGSCVRVFSGHVDFISALECSPNGQILASADGTGSIILWDIAKGAMIKRCKGHGKGGIWSLSFSAESTVLVSGGADGTVRVWDIEVPADPQKALTADGEVVATGGQADATRLTGTGTTTSTGGSGAVSGNVAGGKKKGKETIITPDQISAFPTKKSPVYKVKFTRMNLILAGGCYMP